MAFTATGSVTGVNDANLGTPQFLYYQGSTALSSAPVNAGSYSVVAYYPGSTDYASANKSAAVSFHH